MIQYGDRFQVGEVIIIYVEDEPGFFARIEHIEPDRKKNWWQLNFLVLAIPLKTMSWILDDEQMRGQPFTMNGVSLQIKRVQAPEEEKPIEPSAKSKTPPGENRDNVFSLFDEK
ncbi:MAG: hypothetical protein EHM72_01750 [Calditrichaeota bacterium]|nr:MAG: hypothetical protein EHM72_01750 [Calditrichota bacterium]